MASSFCVACGAPISAGAGFCSYCGKPVSASPATAPPAATPAAPLPAAGLPGGTPGYPGSYAPPYPPPPPRRRRSRLLMVVVIVVVVLVVISVVGFYLFVVESPLVSVSQINVYAPGNVCGLNSNPVGYYGFNDSPGASQALELQLENFNSTSCTVHGVTTNTTGFSVTYAQVPNTVGGHGNGTINVTLALPGSSWSGVLNLVFT